MRTLTFLGILADAGHGQRGGRRAEKIAPTWSGSWVHRRKLLDKTEAWGLSQNRLAAYGLQAARTERKRGASGAAGAVNYSAGRSCTPSTTT